VEIRVRIDNRDRAMRPNAFVEVSLEPDESLRRVQIEESAVVLSGDSSVVFVEREPGKLERVVVQPGRRRHQRVELRSGLEAGMRYVAKGALLLLNQVELTD
jgi:cobalt-zinc-cadmium efflux system membrane fusion protein